MSINKKFIAVITAFIFLPTVIGVFFLNIKIKNDIYCFEDEQSIKNLNSVQAIFAQSIENKKETTFSSWASWDDFHDAVANKDTQWFEDQILSSCRDNDDIAIIADMNGKVLSSYDPQNGFNSKSIKDAPLFEGIAKGQNTYAGFIELPKGLAIVGVSKIIDSSDKSFKNPSGVFIYGNYVTKDILQKASDVVNINSSIYVGNQAISSSDITEDQISKLKNFAEQIKEANGIIKRSSIENGSRKLISVGAVKDLNNNPIGIIECEGYSKASIESLSGLWGIRNISIITIVVILILSTFIILWTHQNIIVPIKKIKEIIDQRDLSNNLPVKGKDELDALSISINSFLAIIRNTLLQIKSSSQIVAASSEEMNATIQQLASSSEALSITADKTMMSMNQLDHSMENVSSSTQEVTKNIFDVNNLLENLESRVNNVNQNIYNVQKQSSISIEATQTGQIAVKDTIEGMNKINVVVSDLVSSIKDLGKSAYEIDEIINVIDDISEQTNLLALNASIEAARAGEYGKGFAVVANAIKSLAEKSSDATKVISNLIKNIQLEVTEAVDKAKAGSVQVNHGVQLVNDAGKTLVTIEDEVGSTAKVVDKVVQLTEEQLEAIKQVVTFSENITVLAKQMFSSIEQQVSSSVEVTQAIEIVSTSSNEMASSTQDISLTTENLAREALNLSSLLDQFKLSDK